MKCGINEDFFKKGATIILLAKGNTGRVIKNTFLNVHKLPFFLG